MGDIGVDPFLLQNAANATKIRSMPGYDQLTAEERADLDKRIANGEPAEQAFNTILNQNQQFKQSEQDRLRNLIISPQNMAGTPTKESVAIDALNKDPETANLSVDEKLAILNNPNSPYNPSNPLNTNPNTADLPFDVKKAILADPTHPLNPANPKNTIETTTPEGAQAASESILQKELAKKQQEQIAAFGGEYLASAEEKRKQLAERLAGKETELQTAYDAEAARREAEAQDLFNQLGGSYESERARRAQELQQQIEQLGQGLASSRTKTFQTLNPALLEDLNRRGLFTSETAVTQAQADALARLQAEDEAKLAQATLGGQNELRDIESQNQARLEQAKIAGLSELQRAREQDLADVQAARQRGTDVLTQFETGAFGQGQDIYGEGLNTLLGGEQSALESALNLRRGKLENEYNLALANADRQFAQDLAAQQKKGSLGRIFASGGKQS